MTAVALESNKFIPLLLLFILSGAVELGGVAELLRSVGMLVIVALLLKMQFDNNATKISEDNLFPYFFIYFAVVILLIQNIVLLMIHGLTILDYSIFEGLVDFSLLDLTFEFYSLLFVLDLVGYLLFALYLYFLQPNPKKMVYRNMGLAGSVGFIMLSLTWRTGSQFYSSFSFIDWFVDNLSLAHKLTMLMAQVVLILTWYCFYRLQLVNPATQSAFLDNKNHHFTSIPRYSLITAIVIAVAAFLSIYWIFGATVQPYGTFLSLYFLMKSLIIPLSFVILLFSLYRRYNLLF